MFFNRFGSFEGVLEGPGRSWKVLKGSGKHDIFQKTKKDRLERFGTLKMALGTLFFPFFLNFCVWDGFPVFFSPKIGIWPYMLQ